MNKILNINKKFFPFLLILPATISIILVAMYPFFKGLQLSFTDYNLLRMKDVQFVGIKNFINILTSDEEFWRVLGFTFIYVFGTVILSYIVGLAIASLMNQNIKGRSIFRALLLIPWVIPSVVAANSWLWVLNDQTGFINISLMKLGLIQKPLLFIAEPAMAKMTVIMMSTWKSFPFMALVLLAGLQNIPKDLYEAAEIDGAGWWHSLIYITMPLLKPVTFVSTILMSIWTFNNFENIYLLTRGGPANVTQVISILTYYTAFFRNKLGYACAISSTMVIFMVIMAQIYMKLLKTSQK